MLRKRTRSYQKDQNMGQLNSDVVSESFVHSDFLANKHKNNSFFNVPGLFVGFNSKNSESDSVRSPTSPLDFRVFSAWGNPFRSPKLSHEGHHQKTWDTNKVGLSIIDSLDYEAKQSGKVLRSSDSKNIPFGPKMKIKTPNFNNCTDTFEAPKSLPKDVGIFPFAKSKPSNLQKGSSDVLFEIGDTPLQPDSLGNFRPCSLDSGRSGSHLSRLANHNSNLSPMNFCSSNGTDPLTSPSQFKVGSVLSDSSGTEQPSIAAASIANSLIGAISPSEIELSEDYTCVRKHGPNPKVTHIFGDCILECHNSELSDFDKNKEEGNALAPTAECSDVPTSYPSSDFLSFCYSCKKKLDGEDIYMYRGEKAFCSWNCRLEEILIDEEIEKCNGNASENSAKPSNCEELSETGLFIST